MADLRIQKRISQAAERISARYDNDSPLSERVNLTAALVMLSIAASLEDDVRAQLLINRAREAGSGASKKESKKGQ